jgi:mono/diheme cytochrome c family protein
MNSLRILGAAFVLSAAPLQLAAQGASLGELEYMNSCVQCHGASGTGDGVIAGYLTTSLPDLTRLQAENDGVFPFARLYEVIEGTADVGAHGTSEMPAWGQRYNAGAERALGLYYGPGDQEQYVRGRILALIEYISTLQE